MRKSILLLGAVCVAGGVMAVDVVLDIKLNGQELEDGCKVAKVMENAILVIEDIGAETNVHKGTFYLLEGKAKGKSKAKGKAKSSYYSEEEARIRIVSNQRLQFGMLVELDTAYLAGIGRATMNKDGYFSQIIISSGHGSFLHAGFQTPPDGGSNTVVAASMDEDVLEELEVGKMQARMNKKLSEKATDSSGTEAVEEWLEDNNYLNHND